jgi:hypothetical protein
MVQELEKIPEVLELLKDRQHEIKAHDHGLWILRIQNS